MPSNKLPPSHAFLLLLASLAYAQDQPAQPSPTSPPFPLDSNGEAHFNIPVVVKLADLNAAAAVAAAAPDTALHRRNPDPNTADDAESPQPLAAFDDSTAKIALAQPVHVEPAFEVSHQGQDEDTADLAARNAPYNPAAAMAGSSGTHTVLLVETTGTAVSTVTGPCSDSSLSSAPITVAVSPPPANTTTTTTATSTIRETAGLPPAPFASGTGYPLRNGTNATLPGSSGGGKPHATGLGAAKSSALGPVNPANGGPSSRLTGGAAGRVSGGGSEWVVLGLGMLGLAAFVG